MQDNGRVWGATDRIMTRAKYKRIQIERLAPLRQPRGMGLERARAVLMMRCLSARQDAPRAKLLRILRPS